MKIAAMFADGSGGTVDRPDPKAVDDFVVVKIRSAPMCTEYKGFKGKQDQDRTGFGHEANRVESRLVTEWWYNLNMVVELAGFV